LSGRQKRIEEKRGEWKWKMKLNKERYDAEVGKRELDWSMRE